MTTGTPTDDLAAWWREVGDGLRRLEDALAAVGRDPAAVPKYLSLDAAGVYALSSVAYLTDAAGRAGDLGFTDVITHWPRPEGPYAGHESVLAAAAADLLPSVSHQSAALATARSADEERQRVGHAGGLLLAIDLDPHPDRRERSEVGLLDVRQRRLGADRRAGEHRRGEANPV